MHVAAMTENFPASLPRSHASRLLSETRPRRILIDCTATFRCDFAGGIQRVVRNLVNSAETLSGELELTCQGVVYGTNLGFLALNNLPVPSEASHGAAFVRANQPEPPVVPMAPNLLLRHRVREILASVGMLEPARRIKQLIHGGPSQVHSAVPSEGPVPLRIGEGDVLLLPDTSWGTPDIWSSVDAAQQRGAKVAAVVYDLIPLRYPSLCGEPFVTIFRQWWDQIRSRADVVVCISNSVWEDVQDYMAHHPAPRANPRPLQGGSFRLGAGLDLDMAPTRVRSELQALFAADALSNPYLMAASFDVRKNHRSVLDAFDRIWAQGIDARLVIIARKYRDHPLPLAEQVVRHPEFNRRLFWFYDIEDGELDYCYRRSAALITASLAEGFNLPIVETLSRGRPVLASDIPVHREVAGDHAAYFPPQASALLADMLLRHQRGELNALDDRLDGFQWPDWHQSSRELLDRVVDSYADGAECPESLS